MGSTAFQASSRDSARARGSDQTSQAREEAEVFADFSRVSGVLDPGEFASANALDIPGPDFVTPDRLRGVELVSYHRDAAEGVGGSRRRRWETKLDRMVLDAKAAFEATGLPRVDVFVFPERRYDGQFPKSAANDLFELVKTCSPEKKTIERPPALERIIEAVDIAPTSPYQAEPLWQVISADWVDVNCAALQVSLDDKEGNVPVYRSHAKEVSLLVYGSPGVYVGAGAGPENDGRWSTCGHVSEELRRTQFRSSFDHVYYFDRDRRGWTRLLTKP